MLDTEALRKRTLQIKRRWGKHEAERSTCAKPDPILGICGSFTVDPIIPYLGSELMERGMITPQIVVGPYNQIFQTCLDHREALGSNVDILVVLLRLEDMFATELSSFIDGDERGLSKALDGADQLAAALRSLRGNFAGPIFVSNAPYPDTIYSDLMDMRRSQRASFLHRKWNDHWYALIAAIEQTHLIDLDGIQRYFGAAACKDPRKWYLYKQPYSEEFCLLIGQVIARRVIALKGPSKKCVIVDCDNTLWGGVIGEDGLEGIEIGSEFPGIAFADFQRQLIELHKEGIFIAIASKNNEEDVWEVFDKHDGMILKRSHLAAWRINWLPKAQNIQEIAQELNIGLDSLVFVDDSHFEIESIRQTLPEVTFIQVPEEPADLPGAFIAPRLFDRLELTSEDFKRTDMISQERDRKEAQGAMDQSDFLNSLDLVARVFEVRDEHVGRFTQLLNKTNQFNLSTIRRTQAQVEELRANSVYHLYAISVTDRFGDYGVVGAAILKGDCDEWDMDTFLLSCRVLGRGVESAFISFIRDVARKAGARKIRSNFIPTSKNKPAETFLPDHGFEKSDGYSWLVDIDQISQVPKHIRIRD